MIVLYIIVSFGVFGFS